MGLKQTQQIAVLVSSIRLLRVQVVAWRIMGSLVRLFHSIFGADVEFRQRVIVRTLMLMHLMRARILLFGLVTHRWGVGMRLRFVLNC